MYTAFLTVHQLCMQGKKLCFMLWLMRSSHINFDDKSYKESLGGIALKSRMKSKGNVSLEGCIIFHFIIFRLLFVDSSSFRWMDGRGSEGLIGMSVWYVVRYCWSFDVVLSTSCLAFNGMSPGILLTWSPVSSSPHHPQTLFMQKSHSQHYFAQLQLNNLSKQGNNSFEFQFLFSFCLCEPCDIKFQQGIKS